MNSKYYSLAELRLCIESDREIADSPLYREFYTGEGPCDIRVRVTEGKLPERTGTLLARSEGREFYEDGGVTVFSSYPQREGDRPFACRRDGEGSVSLTVDYPSGLWDSMLFYALNIPELLVRRDVFMLHCSYVICRGEALLFCAGKGVGKSTQAALWSRYRGAEIVNGDRALLRLTDGGLKAYGTPYCGSSEIALDRAAPVGAVILLEQGQVNELERCQGRIALTRIVEQLSCETYQTEKAVDFALGVCSGVPVYVLRCLPDVAAVSLLEETLWKK